MRLILIATTWSLLSGCVDTASGGADCASGDTRCSPNDRDTVQHCEDGRWSDWAECGLQGETCGLEEGEARCVGAGDHIESSPFGFLDVPPKNFEAYADLSTHWIKGGREGYDWQEVESQPGIYDFSVRDEELCEFFENGQRPIYCIRSINSLYGTTWVEGFPQATDEFPDGHLDAWTAFVERFVERYDGDGLDDADCPSRISLRHYQLVHELAPHGSGYWQDHRDEYARLYEETYQAVRSACSTCTLSMPVPNFSDLQAPTNFLTDVLGHLQGGGVVEVGFDYHNWSVEEGQPEPWRSRGEDYAMGVEYIERIEEIASDHDVEVALITSLESGMAATLEMESDQAAYIVRSYVSCVAHGQAKKFWTRTVEYSSDASVIWAHTGLIHNPLNADGLSHKKLGYFTYKLMVEKLGDSDWENVEIIREDPDFSIYGFPAGGGMVYVVWRDCFDDSCGVQEVTLEVGSGGPATVTEAVPAASSGADIDELDYPGFFPVETRPIVGESLTLEVGSAPLFVEVP